MTLRTELRLCKACLKPLSVLKRKRECCTKVHLTDRSMQALQFQGRICRPSYMLTWATKVFETQMVAQ